MRLVAAAVTLALLVPTSARAWGYEAHKFIVDRLVDLLPADLKPLFVARRAVLVERAIDPDLWRSVGWTAESANHYVDLDHERFGPDPFAGLPHDYDAAVQKFGKEFIEQQGLLPWRTQEFHGRLKREFEAVKRPEPAWYVLDNIVLYAASLAHYVADGHVPLHATTNHDGQLTSQSGLHARWEEDLFERNRNVLKIAPAPIHAIGNPRELMFDTLLASNRLVNGVLAADMAAAEGRKTYDDGYYEAFTKAALPTLEARLNASITAAASMITSAWEAAGRPKVPVSVPRTPRPIRRPNP
jgi:hypothetical protein